MESINFVIPFTKLNLYHLHLVPGQPFKSIHMHAAKTDAKFEYILQKKQEVKRLFSTDNCYMTSIATVLFSRSVPKRRSFRC